MKAKINKKKIARKRKPDVKSKLGQAKFVVKQMSQFMKDGDVTAITDLIASYIANSPKYKTQESFAEIIGTSGQVLHRMLSHDDAVPMKVFFNAIEQIHSDQKAKKLI